MTKLATLPFLLATASLASSPLAAQEATDGALPDYQASLRCAVLLYAAVLSRETGAEPDRSAGGALARYITHAQQVSGKTSEQVVDDMGTSARAMVEEINASPNPAATRDRATALCRAGAASLPPVPDQPGS